MLPNPPRKEHPREAYGDGWAACGRGLQRHEWPSYPTHKEREAFGKGWDDRAERIACGYFDDPECERLFGPATPVVFTDGGAS